MIFYGCEESPSPGLTFYGCECDIMGGDKTGE